MKSTVSGLGLIIFVMGLMGAVRAEPLHVETSPIGDVQFYPRHTAPATVASLNDSQLGAQINARVEEITAEEGQQVEKGSILIRLDCRDSEQELKQARAQWEFARDQFNRIKQLRANRNASEEAYSQRRFELTQAEVARAQAELQVERCIISAPFKGVVLEKMVSIGDLAAPGTLLLRILDTSHIEVDASVPYTLVDSLVEAEEYYFEQRGIRYPLELLRVTDYIDTVSNDQKIYLGFVSTPPLPGAAGRLTWTESRPFLPNRYIVQRDGKLGIFTLDNERARFVVLPDALEGLAAEIDLPPELRIITSGLDALSNDDPVIEKP